MIEARYLPKALSDYYSGSTQISLSLYGVCYPVAGTKIPIYSNGISSGSEDTSSRVYHHYIQPNLFYGSVGLLLGSIQIRLLLYGVCYL